LTWNLPFNPFFLMILSMLILQNYLLIVRVKGKFSYYFASVLNRSQMSFCGYTFLFENDMQNILECIFSLMTSLNKDSWSDHPGALRSWKNRDSRRLPLAYALQRLRWLILILKTPVEYTKNVDIVCLLEINANFDESRCFASGWRRRIR